MLANQQEKQSSSCSELELSSSTTTCSKSLANLLPLPRLLHLLLAIRQPPWQLPRACEIDFAAFRCLAPTAPRSCHICFKFTVLLPQVFRCMLVCIIGLRHVHSIIAHWHVSTGFLPRAGPSSVHEDVVVIHKATSRKPSKMFLLSLCERRLWLRRLFCRSSLC